MKRTGICQNPNNKSIFDTIIVEIYLFSKKDNFWCTVQIESVTFHIH